MIEIRNCPAYIKGRCSTNLNKLWDTCDLIVDCPLKQVLRYILNSECGYVYTCEENSEFGGNMICDNSGSDCGKGRPFSLLDVEVIKKLLDVKN